MASKLEKSPPPLKVDQAMLLEAIVAHDDPLTDEQAHAVLHAPVPVSLDEGAVAQLKRVALRRGPIRRRIAAIYALRRTQCSDAALAALVDLLNDAGLLPQLRGEAAEGLGSQCACGSLPKNLTIRRRIEHALREGLNDPSPTVRFWCCYAVGQSRLRAALPRLRILKARDTAICRGWWRVGEEAADAIAWMHGKPGKDRVPGGYRNWKL